VKAWNCVRPLAAGGCRQQPQAARGFSVSGICGIEAVPQPASQPGRKRNRAAPLPRWAKGPWLVETPRDADLDHPSKCQPSRGGNAAQLHDEWHQQMICCPGCSGLLGPQGRTGQLGCGPGSGPPERQSGAPRRSGVPVSSAGEQAGRRAASHAGDQQGSRWVAVAGRLAWLLPACTAREDGQDVQWRLRALVWFTRLPGSATVHFPGRPSQSKSARLELEREI